MRQSIKRWLEKINIDIRIITYLLYIRVFTLKVVEKIKNIKKMKNRIRNSFMNYDIFRISARTEILMELKNILFL